MNSSDYLLFLQIPLAIIAIVLGLYWSTPYSRWRMKVGIYSPWITIPLLALYTVYTGDFTAELGLLFFLIAASFSGASAMALFIATRNKKHLSEE